MIALLIALTAAAETSSGVPASFQGGWSLDLRGCPPAISDQPVWIGAKQIRMDHSVGDVRVIKATGERDITIAGELRSDGDPRNAELRLQLSDTGSELRVSEGNWSGKLLRCPDEEVAK